MIFIDYIIGLCKHCDLSMILQLYIHFFISARTQAGTNKMTGILSTLVRFYNFDISVFVKLKLFLFAGVLCVE